jgi:hypothetical protein
VRSARLAASALVLWAAMPGLAGDAPTLDDTTEEIVIQAKRREALRAFVEALAQVGHTGQLARWDGRICPTVLGIESAQATWIEDRIVEIGSSVKLQRASDTCKPSLFIIVTEDAAGLAKELADARPKTLSTDGRSRLKRFVESDRPIRWLSVTDPCGDAYECNRLPDSRLKMATRPELLSLLVIADARRLGGFSLAEVADYVALVALTNPSSDEAPVQSILSMFDRERAPDMPFALTDWDQAFLAGLYKSGADLSGRAQRNAIVRSMGKPAQSASSPP